MASMFDLTGRAALVTGGGFGIGRSLCEGLAEHGAAVCVADINEESAQETVEILSKDGHKAMAIKADVSDPEDVERMVARTVEAFGKLDIASEQRGRDSGPLPGA